LEKEGETLQAVVLYESLLEKNFVGSRPYDRLAIIYKKLKRPNDAIRVLEKAVEMQKSEYNIKAKDWPGIKNYPGHRKKLESYIEKLEKAKGK
jgi:tetratricopeptide (TPR) repeat protein